MEKNTTGTIQTRISRFLFLYRRILHTTMGVVLAELLLGRISRSHLDLLKPGLSSRVKSRQEAQQRNHNIHCKERKFVVGDSVFIRDFPSKKLWIPGVISSVEGPQSYHIMLMDDRIVHRHVNHIRKQLSDLPLSTTGPNVDYPSIPSNSEVGVTTSPHATPTSSPPTGPTIRRSVRLAPPPNYLDYGQDLEPRLN